MKWFVGNASFIKEWQIKDMVFVKIHIHILLIDKGVFTNETMA